MANFSPVEQVFGNSLLLDRILKQAIHSSQGFEESTPAPTSYPDLCNIRLVCRNWLQSVMRIYRTAKQPLYHLQLKHGNFCAKLRKRDEILPKQGSETVLNKFTDYMGNWGWPVGTDNYPPFRLELTTTFFPGSDERVYTALYNFLMEYAPHGMIHFTFSFHRNQFNYIPTQFPEFNFPKLRHITLLIERMAWSFIPLLQKLLESAPKLETLDFTSASCIVTYSVSHLSEIIGKINESRPYTLTLPRSTRKISLYGTVDSCSCFYTIPTGDLVKLESLKLSAAACFIRQSDEMMEPLKDHLKALHLIGFASCVYTFNRHYQVALPQMSALESLTVNMPWELRMGRQFLYQKYFPKLKELTIVHCEQDVFLNLFCGQSCPTMEKCTVVACRSQMEVELREGHRNITTNQLMAFTSESTTQNINRSFPNLTHLGIGVAAAYTLSLRYVFSQMTNLKSLAIFVETSIKIQTDIHWDALFTGLDTTTCETLSKDKPGDWDATMINGDEMSIRNLKNLEALYLVETSYPGCRTFSFGLDGSGGRGHGSCDFVTETLPTILDYRFSELSFYFAFFKMEKLQKLSVTRGFLPGESIRQMWKERKGIRMGYLKSPKLYHLLTERFSLHDDNWYKILDN